MSSKGEPGERSEPTRPGSGEPKERKGPSGRSRNTRRLSLAAIGLAVAAVVAAFLVPGPPGSGTLMAHSSRGGPVTIGSTCTHYPGAEVTIAVPRAGNVVVSATVGVGINHTFGVADVAQIVVAATNADCAVTNHTAFVSVPQVVGTDPTYFATVPLLRTFPVSGAASLTFYVNAVMVSGADARDRFDSASLVAVFYPA